MYKEYEEMMTSYKILEEYIEEQVDDYIRFVNELKEHVHNLSYDLDDVCSYAVDEYNALRKRARFNYSRAKRVLNKISNAIELINKDVKMASIAYKAIKDSYDYQDLMQTIAFELSVTNPRLFKVMRKSVNNKELLKQALIESKEDDFLKYSLLTDAMALAIEYESQTGIDTCDILVPKKLKRNN